MDLSVIIVSWNVKEKLKDNLQALFESESGFNFEVLVVDNASTDGSAELVRAKFPQVKLIVNETNFGFARANNQAIELAQGRYILLLNPDMSVFPDTLENMLAWAEENPQATVSGCRLVNVRGETVRQVRRFPKLFDQLMITWKIPHFFPGILNSYLLPDFDYSRVSQVDSIRGAFFLINLKNYQKISRQPKPKLDERYFLWFEEVDFCRQVIAWQGEVWYTPAASCLDYVGQSFKQLKRGKAQKYFRDSMLKYFKKWESAFSYQILNLSWRFLSLFLK
ncbi:MAG: glycosyltransferase family 2 protein [Patescibacteria group bacterium]|jgi:hypothetical protein|nr:glycosyltransferase family 2 protein [bacterium]HQC49805.1 glycosyltransferase family 2 protein [bacterium]